MSGQHPVGVTDHRAVLAQVLSQITYTLPTGFSKQSAQKALDEHRKQLKNDPAFGHMNGVGQELDNFIVLESNHDMICFMDPTNEVLHFSFRGSMADSAGYFFRDWIVNDGLIALGLPGPRMLTAMGFVNDITARYPDYAIDMSGHSLGGSVAMFVGAFLGVRRLDVFNPGSSPLRETMLVESLMILIRGSRDHFNIHHIPGDPISTWAAFYWEAAGMNVTRYSPVGNPSPIGAHSLENFNPMSNLWTVNYTPSSSNLLFSTGTVDAILRASDGTIVEQHHNSVYTLSEHSTAGISAGAAALRSDLVYNIFATKEGRIDLSAITSHALQAAAQGTMESIVTSYASRVFDPATSSAMAGMLVSTSFEMLHGNWQRAGETAFTSMANYALQAASGLPLSFSQSTTVLRDGYYGGKIQSGTVKNMNLDFSFGGTARIGIGMHKEDMVLKRHGDLIHRKAAGFNGHAGVGPISAHIGLSRGVEVWEPKTERHHGILTTTYHERRFMGELSVGITVSDRTFGFRSPAFNYVDVLIKIKCNADGTPLQSFRGLKTRHLPNPRAASAMGRPSLSTSRSCRLSASQGDDTDQSTSPSDLRMDESKLRERNSPSARLVKRDLNAILSNQGRNVDHYNKMKETKQNNSLFGAKKDKTVTKAWEGDFNECRSQCSGLIDQGDGTSVVTATSQVVRGKVIDIISKKKNGRRTHHYKPGENSKDLVKKVDDHSVKVTVKTDGGDLATRETLKDGALTSMADTKNSVLAAMKPDVAGMQGKCTVTEHDRAQIEGSKTTTHKDKPIIEAVHKRGVFHYKQTVHNSLHTRGAAEQLAVGDAVTLDNGNGTTTTTIVSSYKVDEYRDRLSKTTGDAKNPTTRTWLPGQHREMTGTIYEAATVFTRTYNTDLSALGHAELDNQVVAGVTGNARIKLVYHDRAETGDKDYTAEGGPAASKTVKTEQAGTFSITQELTPSVPDSTSTESFGATPTAVNVTHKQSQQVVGQVSATTGEGTAAVVNGDYAGTNPELTNYNFGDKDLKYDAEKKLLHNDTIYTAPDVNGEKACLAEFAKPASAGTTVEAWDRITDRTTESEGLTSTDLAAQPAVNKTRFIEGYLVNTVTGPTSIAVDRATAAGGSLRTMSVTTIKNCAILRTSEMVSGEGSAAITKNQMLTTSGTILGTEITTVRDEGLLTTTVTTTLRDGEVTVPAPPAPATTPATAPDATPPPDGAPPAAVEPDINALSENMVFNDSTREAPKTTTEWSSSMCRAAAAGAGAITGQALEMIFDDRRPGVTLQGRVAYVAAATVEAAVSNHLTNLAIASEVASTTAGLGAAAGAVSVMSMVARDVFMSEPATPLAEAPADATPTELAEFKAAQAKLVQGRKLDTITEYVCAAGKAVGFVAASEMGLFTKTGAGTSVGILVDVGLAAFNIMRGKSLIGSVGRVATSAATGLAIAGASATTANVLTIAGVATSGVTKNATLGVVTTTVGYLVAKACGCLVELSSTWWDRKMQQRRYDQLAAAFEVSQRAAENEVRRSYRKRAILAHPDKNRGSNEAFIQLTADMEELLRLRILLGYAEARVEGDRPSWWALFRGYMAHLVTTARRRPAEVRQLALEAPDVTETYFNPDSPEFRDLQNTAVAH